MVARPPAHAPEGLPLYRGTVFNMDFDSGDLSRLESLRRLSFRAAGSPNARGPNTSDWS